jgi:diguanylate cyclase (GGDEF)-like protein/PAS domain S-box-containing protein
MPARNRLLRPYGFRHADRSFVIVCAVAGLLTIGFGAALALRIEGLLVADAIRGFGEAAAALVAAVACMTAATLYSGRTRFAWVLLGTAALAWATGEGYWSYFDVVQGQQLPFPSLADAGHLALVPLAVAGIAVFPGRQRTASRLAFLLDGAILAGALVLISWATVLGNVVHAGADIGPSALTGLAYPLSDIVLAVMALLLVGRTTGLARLPLLLVMAGVFANLLTDSASAYLTTVTTHGPEQILGTGWVAGFLLIALGAVRSSLVAGSASRAEERPPGRWTVVVPYIPVAVAAVIAVLKNVNGPPEALLLWDLMVVVALVIVRQFIVILDNQTLSQKVALQTAALRDSEEHFRSLVQNSGDVVVLADADGVVRFVSTSIDRFFAYTSTELVGQPFSGLLHPDDQPAFAGGLKKALTASALPVAVDCRFRHKLGSWTHCDVTITNLLHRSSSQALVLNIRDVTDRKEMEDRLAYLGAHDPVTNLPNRMAFRRLIDEALERSAPGRAIAVLAIDIDDFKLVNDALGHHAGDDVLGMVGGRLGKIVSAGDVVARVGADEFGILMKTVLNDGQPSHLAERIFQHFRAPFKVEEREMVMRLSIGIAAQGALEDTAENLMRNADLALNAAKTRGKGRYERYEPKQHAAVSDRMELESELAHALERRQFVLHYQPTVRLGDGTIIGFEALVRWDHPRRGLLSPGDFLGLAEETGMSSALQRWVLGQACADGKHWQISFPVEPALQVSVNISQHGLVDADLVADVTNACTAAAFPPERLILELTEGATLEGRTTVSRLLELHERGVSVALDDFGAHAAPLSSLRDLPVDIVKLDHSFVARMTTSPTDATVARAVIDLGNKLGMITIADGIERADQLAALREMGCLAGQGYYLSRPLPAAGIDRLLAACGGDGGLILPTFRLERAS